MGDLTTEIEDKQSQNENNSDCGVVIGQIMHKFMGFYVDVCMSMRVWVKKRCEKEIFIADSCWAANKEEVEVWHEGSELHRQAAFHDVVNECI